MSWRDHLRPAKWRGVPFFVVDTTTSVGRKTVVHEYPFKDMPYVEDLGQSADEYQIIGHVIQNKENEFDYFTQRDRLIKALRDTSGKGTLVHPWLGSLEVALAGKVSFTESFREGGIARFDMRFVQAGVNTFPKPTTDHITGMENVKTASDTKMTEGFSDKYSVKKLKTHLSNSAIGDITEGYKGFKDGVNKMKGISTSIRSTVSNTISNAQSKIASLITSPGLIAGNFTTTFNSVYDTLIDTSGDILSMIRTSLTLAGFSSNLDSIPATTDTREQEQKNRDAIIDFFRYESVIQASRTAVSGTFDSSTEAIEIMKEIVDSLNAALLVVGGGDPNDKMFKGIQDIRPAIVAAMKDYGATDVPVLVNYQIPPGAQSSLVLSYEKYKDLDREEDIVDRNPANIKHPGFMPGGETISILSS